jgi:DNA-binding IclR family transcriptional regulator
MMKADTPQREIRVQTVERALMILEIMAKQNETLPLTQIGKLVKLNLSTTYRLLNVLCRSGFVEREKGSGNYRLGLKAFLIGNTVLQRIDLREIAMPYLNQLMQTSGESVYLAILSNQNVVYADGIKTIGPIQINIQTGVQIPACKTNAGKVLLANLDKQEQHYLANQYLREYFIENEQNLLAELDGIRFKRYSSGTSGFNETIHEISAPVFNYLNKCGGAISVFYQANGSVPHQERSLLEQVNETAGSISRAMGYREYQSAQAK